MNNLEQIKAEKFHVVFSEDLNGVAELISNETDEVLDTIDFFEAYREDNLKPVYEEITDGAEADEALKSNLTIKRYIQLYLGYLYDARIHAARLEKQRRYFQLSNAILLYSDVACAIEEFCEKLKKRSADLKFKSYWENKHIEQPE